MKLYDRALSIRCPASVTDLTHRLGQADRAEGMVAHEFGAPRDDVLHDGERLFVVPTIRHAKLALGHLPFHGQCRTVGAAAGEQNHHGGGEMGPFRPVHELQVRLRGHALDKRFGYTGMGHDFLVPRREPGEALRKQERRLPKLLVRYAFSADQGRCRRKREQQPFLLNGAKRQMRRAELSREKGDIGDSIDDPLGKDRRGYDRRHRT